MTIKPIKPVRQFTITDDKGKQVVVEYLAKGQFHTCYVDRQAAPATVYSVTIDRPDLQHQDYSKEILSHPQLGTDPSPHIPTVECIGEIGDRRVYRMPLYRPLKAEHKQAWKVAKRLQAARDEAWKEVVREQVTPRKMRLSDIGAMVNDRVCQSAYVPEPIKEALENLRDAAANYGSSYVFEFAVRNLAVDENGTLILLDVLFNLEAAEEIRNKRVRRAGGGR